MLSLISRPVYSSLHDNIADCFSSRDRVIVAGESSEDRASPLVEIRRHEPDRFWIISETDELNRASSSFRGVTTELSLRDPSQLLSAVAHAASGVGLDIDLTSLPAHIWAPLIKICWDNGLSCRALYIEPDDYTRSDAPRIGALFDLSERILGISPLPGFASFRRIDEDKALLVPLIGFEGARLSFIVDHLEPKKENIFPIVGAPGFKKEYPFHSFLGNQIPLLDTKSWMNAQYSRANCAFSAYYAIDAVSQARRDYFLRIAPIGTKPHCLGAVLYALAHPGSCELIYDHPKRSRARTSGVSRVSAFDIGTFQSELALAC